MRTRAFASGDDRARRRRLALAAAGWSVLAATASLADGPAAFAKSVATQNIDIQNINIQYSKVKITGAPARTVAEGRPKLAPLIPASLRRFHAADYPEVAFADELEADIRCALDIDDRGAVELADCQEGAAPALVHAAEQALARAQFAPGTINGYAVYSRLPFTYRFAIAADRLPEQSKRRAGYLLVEGEVLTQGVRKPIAGADVIAEGLGIATSTDGHGRFRIWVPPGSQVLVASAPGTSPDQLRVEAGEPGEGAIELFLRPREVNALSVTVAGEKDRRVNSREQLSREEMRNVPGSQGDPLRVVELLPGLARAPYTGGQLIVRGANAEDTGAYIDGQRIPQLYHLQNGPSVIGEEMVDHIDFSAGGAGAYYGRSLAGIVSVSSRRGDPERWHGSLTVDLQKSAAFLQGPLGGDTELSLGARHSYVNPLLEAVANSNKSYTVPIYWDYQLRLDHKLSSRDALSLTALGSNDNYEQIGNGRGTVPAALAQQVGFHRVRLAWEHRIDSDIKLTIAPSFGIDSSNSSEAGQGAGIFLLPQTDLERSVSSGGRAEISFHPADLVQLRTGLDILINRVHYDVDQLYDNQIRGLGAPNAEQSVRSGIKIFGSYAEYIEGELKYGALKISPGARFEQLHYGAVSFALFEPRLGARYSLNDPTTLFAYTGIYHQAPDPEEVDAVLGNPSLLPLRADQFGAGVERKFGDVWTLKAEGFLNYRTSLVFPAAAHLNPDGSISNPLELNSGTGHSYGLELFVRREFDARWYGWIAYTLSRSRETSAPGQPWIPTPYDQPHVLNMLLGLRVSPLIELAVRLRVASGNPIAPVISSAYDADSGNYVPIYGPLGAARLPTFVQLDFELNSVWLAELFQFSIYVDLENILNRDNPELILYDYRYQQSETALSTPFQALVGMKAAF